MQINGDVIITFSSAMKDFDASKRGVVTVYMRDFSAGSYTEIGNSTLDATPWQGGTSSFVTKFLTIPNVNYDLTAGHCLEIKFMVGGNADDDMWFAYDTIGYVSRVTLPTP